MPGFEDAGIHIPEGMSLGKFFSQATQLMMKTHFEMVIPGESATHSYRTLHFLNVQHKDLSYVYRATTHRGTVETDGMYIPHPLNGLNRFFKPTVNYRHYTTATPETVVLRDQIGSAQRKVTLSEDYANEDDAEKRRQIELLLIDFINLKHERLYVPITPESNEMALTVNLPT
jgi:hypothetical protein